MTRRLDEILSRIGSATQNELTAELKRLRDREADPGARDAIERTLSSLSERVYAARAAKPAARDDGRQNDDERERARESVARIRGDVRDALETGQWRRASALLVMLSDQPRALVGDLAALRAEIAERARPEAERVLAQVRGIERDEGPIEARRWLAENAERFPTSPEYDELHAALGSLEERALAAEAALAAREREDLEEASDPTPTELEALEAAVLASKPIPEDADPLELARMARDASAAGDLAYARQCWLAASRKLPPGEPRDAHVGEAQDLRARLLMRNEIVDAFRHDPAVFADLGIESVSRDGWKYADGATRLWKELALDELLRVGARVDLSTLGRRGILCEALRSGSAAERERAAAEIAAQVERGEILGADAANIVARAVGGLGANERFLIERGKWIETGSPESATRVEDERRLAKAFLDAKYALDTRGEALDAAFEALVGGAGDLAVRKALHDRTAAALKALERGKALAQLSSLDELRTELDAARKAALDAIFDERTYFYPYNPPEPPKTASDYAKAQQRVNELVSAVRDVWERTRTVKLPREFHAAVAEVAWCRDAHRSLGAEFALPAKYPEYVLAIPPGQAEVDLASFARTPAEARDLAWDRAVLVLNERKFADAAARKLVLAADALPDPAEAEQVRITNEYRRMMGRRALAWNPRIQSAAQGHSDYMADTGHFGHYEEGDPARHSPFDRMKLAGYTKGVSENCAMVGGDPGAAHDGWLNSSGHHRNILMIGHREMASASAANYWTQNFGVDTAFQSELVLDPGSAPTDGAKRGQER